MPPINTLAEFEDFVATNWLHSLGSDEAQAHVRAKLEEEITELIAALENESSGAIISEMGDVLWTSAAVALNEGLTLQEAIQRSSIAAHLPKAALSLDDIDTAATTAIPTIQWDLPAVQAVYDMDASAINEKISSGDVDMTHLALKYLAGRLGKSARILHVLSDYEDGWTDLHRARTTEELSELIILVSYIAQSRLGSSLSAAIADNHTKLSARVASGQPITKAPRR